MRRTSACIEELRRRRLDFEEGFTKPLDKVPHRLYRTDEIAEAAVFAPLDQFGIVGRIDLQGVAGESAARSPE